MKNYPHPGRIVRQEFLEPLGLTVTEAAKVLGVARQTINNLVNERAGVSAKNGRAPIEGLRAQPPICWVRVQANYDLSRCGKTRSVSRATSALHRSPLRVGTTPNTKLWVRTTRLVVPAGPMR